MKNNNIEKKINEVEAILARYHEIEQSDILKEYMQLKDTIESLAFRMDKRKALETRFEETEAYSELKGVKKLFRHAIAHRWNRKRKSRWNATEQGKKDIRFTKLGKNNDILTYLKADAKQIAEWESYKTLINDDLNNAANWDAGFPVPAGMKSVFSSAKQGAAITGHNHSCSDSVLSLEVRKEHVKTSAWDKTHGFYPAEFNYTGDVMNTAAHFTMSKGLLLVKVRFLGKSDGCIYLSAGADKKPIVIAESDGHDHKWQVYSYELDSKDKYCLCAAANLRGGKHATGSVEIDWVKAFAKK